MDTLLRSLLYQWSYVNKLRDKMFEDMPDYRETENALQRARENLLEILSPEAQELLEVYNSAQNASSALESDASILCGAHICLRLLVTLL